MQSAKQKPLTNTNGVDWLMISLYTFFVFYGWISIYAAVYKPETSDIFNLSANHGKQLAFIAMAVILGFVILFSDYEIYPTLSYLLYGIVLLLMIAVIFVGTEIKGARSWFDLGILNFNPQNLANTR